TRGDAAIDAAPDMRPVGDGAEPDAEPGADMADAAPPVDMAVDGAVDGPPMPQDMASPDDMNATDGIAPPEDMHVELDRAPPDEGLPDVLPPDLAPPDLGGPDAERPDVELPDVEPPDVELPDVELPDVEPPVDLGPSTDAAPPACADDPFEPNDALIAPTLLVIARDNEETYPDLRVCPDNEDWYIFDVCARGHVRVEVTFSHADGDLDLHLFGPDLLPIALAESDDDNETLDLDVPFGPLFARVFGAPEVTNDYTLTVAIDCPCRGDDDCAEGLVCQGGDCVPPPDCADDSDCPAPEVCRQGECVPPPPPDGTCAGPFPLAVDDVAMGTTAGVGVDLGDCGGNERAAVPEVVYALTLEAAGTYCLNTRGSAFDTVLYVRGECGAPGTQLACRNDNPGINGAGGQAALDLTLDAPGTVFVFVDGYSGLADRINEGDYTLSVTEGICRPPPECAPETEVDDCGAEQRCFEGQCVRCIEDPDCPPTDRCVANRCTDCTFDADCAEGLRCTPDHVCVACIGDADCGPAEVCRVNRCEPDPTLNGTCLAPAEALVDVVYHGFTDGVGQQVGTCGHIEPNPAAPEVVYRFEPPAPGPYCANSAGSLFDSVVYARTECDAPATEIACNDDARPITGSGAAALDFVAEGPVYVFVDGFSTANVTRRGPYDLVITAGPCRPPPECLVDADCPVGEVCADGECVLAPCVDDNDEENDDRIDSTGLALPAARPAQRLCAQDDDWYRAQVCAGGALSARIEFAHAAADLTLEAIRDSGEVADRSASLTDAESVRVQVGDDEDETVYLRVLGPANASTDYALSASMACPECVFPEDCGEGELCLGEGPDRLCLAARRPAVGEVIVSEVMADPIGEETFNEWFELSNRTDETLWLRDVRVIDDSQDAVHINTDLLLPPRGQVVIARQAANNGGLPRVDFASPSFNLALAGDALVVLGADGRELSAFRYDAGLTFLRPLEASLQLDGTLPPDGDATDPAAWCPATQVYGPGGAGSPGAPNAACPPWPPGLDTDGVFALFTDRCFGCHLGGEFAHVGNFNMDAFPEAVIGVPSDDRPAIQLIAPGDRAGSYLFRKVAGSVVEAGGEGAMMPIGGPFLDAAELEGLGQWIDGLAPP
ncbi:MAG: lamin tail domain-containing protein, partial [Myxococcales bacterium]|nr:lamin tail domain-containing protein [Myxococcales bacterium]